MKISNIKGNMMILIATLIWGTGIVAQSAGMDYVGPFTFNAVRFFIGGCVALGPSLLFSRQYRKKQLPQAKQGSVLKAGIMCGLVLFLSCSLKQFALLHTTVSKVSFITSLYVIIVPIAGLFFGRKAPMWVWLGVAVSVVGMYFLSLSGGMSVNVGDILVFICAFFFAAQILFIDHYSPKHDTMALACIQFFTTSAVSFIMAFIFETPSIPAIIDGLGYLLYAGILVSGVAYILQIRAQKSTDPAVASVLFSMEAVIATFTGWLILREVLTPRELIGCGLLLLAVLIAQMPESLGQKILRNKT